MCSNFAIIHREFSWKLCLQKLGYSYSKVGNIRPPKIYLALYRLDHLPNIKTLPKNITAQNIYHLLAPLFCL